MGAAIAQAAPYRLGSHSQLARKLTTLNFAARVFAVANTVECAEHYNVCSCDRCDIKILFFYCHRDGDDDDDNGNNNNNNNTYFIEQSP
jgi:hypothetical protein